MGIVRGTVRAMLHVVAAIGLFLVTRAMIVEMYKIPTGSMQRTLLAGDFLVVNKFSFGPAIPFTHVHIPELHRPHPGEVIVFKWPIDPRENFVKRIVGVGGDTLRMRDGILYRNGHRLDEPYAVHTGMDGDASNAEFRWQRSYLIPSLHATGAYSPSRNNWGPLVVPLGQYFVLGDNRDNSLDSRYWGFVPDSMVRGTPMFVYYSYRPDSASRWSWLTRARWRRLGTVVR